MLMARRQRGISLLESMIAIVLVALGVLGILGVQLRTLADTQTAVRRAQAIRLIEDLSERMQANPSALAPGVVNRYEVLWGAVTGAVPNCAAGCNAGDMARADIAQWKDTVARTLPLGDATVFAATTANATSNVRTQLGVMLSWRENEREGANDAESNAYKEPFAMPSTGGANVRCPADRICHLQYLQPTMRCLVRPNTLPALACP